MEQSKQEKEIYELAELLMQSENLEADDTFDIWCPNCESTDVEAENASEDFEFCSRNVNVEK